MTEANKNADAIAFLKKYIPFATIYCLGISGSYLFGYWSSFGINVFEYIDVNEIILLSLGDVYIYLILFSIWTLILYGYSVEYANRTAGRLASKLIKKTHILWYAAVIALIVSIFIPIFTTAKWLLWAMVVLRPASIIWGICELFEYKFIPEIKNREISAFIFGSMFFFPFLSIHYGVQATKDVIYGHSYLYINSSPIYKDIEVDNDAQLRYIGKLGGSFFFYYAEVYAYHFSKEEFDKFPFWHFLKPVTETHYHKPRNESIIIVPSQEAGSMRFYRYNK